MEQHCRDFMKFVDDCAVYCLGKCGLKYESLEHPEESVTHFTNYYGDAVLQYHGAHDEMYRKRIRKRSLDESLTPERLLQYMDKGIKKCFGGTAPIMEGILTFCSLYIDTAIFCFRYQKADMINTFLVTTVSVAFQDHVIKLFSVADPTIIPAMWNEIVLAGLALVEREKNMVQTAVQEPVPGPSTEGWI